MANKIHIFKKSAIEAGYPENYYLNPSDNLMKVTTEWRIIEHEDFLSLTVHTRGIGDFVTMLSPGNFISLKVEEENQETAARFNREDEKKKFCIEMNPKFLELGIKRDEHIRISESTQLFFISKLKK